MSEDIYGVCAIAAEQSFPAPDLPYLAAAAARPAGAADRLDRLWRDYPPIHLAAYRHAGFSVTALSSRSRSARRRAARRVFSRGEDCQPTGARSLARDDVRVVDITTSPEVRPEIMEAALRAGKHVLSQKPFVLDLASGPTARRSGGRISDYATRGKSKRALGAALFLAARGARGRLDWGRSRRSISPCIGITIGFAARPLKTCRNCCSPTSPFIGSISPAASLAIALRGKSTPPPLARPSQRARPPFLAHACVEFDAGQATLVFNADTAHGPDDRTTLVGSRGTLRSSGPDLLASGSPCTPPKGSRSRNSGAIGFAKALLARWANSFARSKTTVRLRIPRQRQSPQPRSLLCRSEKCRARNER